VCVLIDYIAAALVVLTIAFPPLIVLLSICMCERVDDDEIYE